MSAQNVIPSPTLSGRRAATLFLFCATGLLLLPGCGPTKQEIRAIDGVNAYFAADFKESQRRLAPLSEKPDENFVLNNCRLGSAALARYDLDEAEAAFLRAYEVINSVGVNEGGRSLGAALVNEKIKIWKGEPYERAMANFYLGLIYYIRHDYNNARAAFENALFKLRDYDQKDGPAKDDYRRVDSDFALANLMLGRCYQRLGRDDQARANFDRAVQLQRGLRPVADARLNAESNVLLVVDFGTGPRKVTNYDGSIVGLGPTPREAGPLPLPNVTVDGRPQPLDAANRPTVDLLALAQERKWQSIDTIRAVKSAVGTGLIAAGAADNAFNRHSNGATDLALVGAGLLLKATSQADVRQWEMLPRTVYLLPLKLPPGKHDITVRFPQVPGIYQTWRDLDVPEEGEATYYFHMQPRNTGPFQWPPPALAELSPSRQPAPTTGTPLPPPSPKTNADPSSPSRADTDPR